MKNLKTLTVATLVLGAAVFYQTRECTKQCENLLLENIEALADDSENNSDFQMCVGDGSVYCEAVGSYVAVKVYRLTPKTSLY